MHPFKFNAATKSCTATHAATADEIVSTSLEILAVGLPRTDALENPDAAAKYLVTQFAGLEHEVFTCLFLNNWHRVLRYEEMFGASSTVARFIHGWLLRQPGRPTPLLGSSLTTILQAWRNPAGQIHSWHDAWRMPLASWT